MRIRGLSAFDLLEEREYLVYFYAWFKRLVWINYPNKLLIIYPN